MADEIGEQLRDMAAHRGLKLVKSRRRKPGTGDYGMFGLTDLSGKPLLGISDGGLTASREDIEAYLRKGSTDTWRASADVTPARLASTTIKAVEEKGQEDEPAIHLRARRAGAAGAKRKGSEGRSQGRTERAAEEVSSSPNARDKRGADADTAEPTVKPKARSEPEADLVIRAARSGDAAELAPLLSQLARADIDELAVARNLEAVRRAKGGMAVAEYRDLVGFCSWAVVPTVQHGAIGRITLLLVDEDHRRRGIATALIDAATAALRKAGCSRIEAMSDIEIANAHGFFRTLKFEQTSYRFARKIDPPE